MSELITRNEEQTAAPDPRASSGTRRRARVLEFAAGVLIGGAITALVAYLVPPTSAAGGLEPGDLVIVSGRDQSDGRQRQELVNQWNQQHPENQARIEELPYAADMQYSEMVARAQRKDAVDIYNLDVAWIAEFAENGYLKALDESTTDISGFMAQPLETCRYDGELWALPFNSDAGLLYYRDPPVGEAPTTWQEIEGQTRRVFAEPHDERLVAGYTGQLDDYEGLVVNALEAIWAASGELVDKDGNVQVNSAEAETGLNRLASGLRPATLQVILPDARRQDETASWHAFAEGKTLTMRNWPVAYRHLRQLNSDGAAQQQFFQVGKLPGPSVLGGQNLAIASTSTKPRAAQALIEFLTSPRSQQILFERGGFAATREIVYRDAEVRTRYPYANVLLDAIERSRLRPKTPHYTRFAETFRAVVNETFDSGQVPDNATDRLTAALRGE